MDTIGSRLKYAREMRMLTQEELAERSRIPVVTISRIENDRYESKPRVATIRALGTALTVEPIWLMFGDADTKKAAA